VCAKQAVPPGGAAPERARDLDHDYTISTRTRARGCKLGDELN